MKGQLILVRKAFLQSCRKICPVFHGFDSFGMEDDFVQDSFYQKVPDNFEDFEEWFLLDMLVQMVQLFVYQWYKCLLIFFIPKILWAILAWKTCSLAAAIFAELGAKFWLSCCSSLYIATMPESVQGFKETPSIRMHLSKMKKRVTEIQKELLTYRLG